MRTYIVKQKGDTLRLIFNCNIADYEDEILDKEDIRDFDNEDCLEDFSIADKNLVDKYGNIIDENNNDILIEGDWVYISKDGKILHIDDSEVQHFGHLKWQLVMNGNYDEALYDEYEEKRQYALTHPRLLTVEEDVEFIKPDARIERMTQRGN